MTPALPIFRTVQRPIHSCMSLSSWSETTLIGSELGRHQHCAKVVVVDSHICICVPNAQNSSYANRKRTSRTETGVREWENDRETGRRPTPLFRVCDGKQHVSQRLFIISRSTFPTQGLIPSSVPHARDIPGAKSQLTRGTSVDDSQQEKLCHLFRTIQIAYLADITRDVWRK